MKKYFYMYLCVNLKHDEAFSVYIPEILQAVKNANLKSAKNK